MITALLPVKVFNRSKQRLAGFLSPRERVELARAMFDDVCETLQEALAMRDALELLLVISAEPYVIARCRELRVSCLEENEQLSHSASVSRATEWAVSMGSTSLLSVPIDTPAVTAAEILSLLKLRDEVPVVVVPSADGRGTNALLRTPPDAIRPRFGPESCGLHIQEAQEKRLRWSVFRSPGFGADIDTFEDLQVFATNGQPSRTLALARQLLAVNREATACPQPTLRPQQ